MSATSPTRIPSLPPRTSTVNKTSVRASRESPIAVRARNKLYHDLCRGMVFAPFVTICADPATAFQISTCSRTCLPSAKAWFGCTMLAWFAESMFKAGAYFTIAYDCAGFSNAEYTAPSEAANPTSVASRSADGKGRKKCALMAICACSCWRNASVVCRTVCRVPPGGVSLKRIPGARSSIFTMWMCKGRGAVSVRLMWVTPRNGCSTVSAAHSAAARAASQRTRTAARFIGRTAALAALRPHRDSGRCGRAPSASRSPAPRAAARRPWERRRPAGGQ